MNITCPKCGFGRNVDEAKLPSKAVMATCPKCQHRFKFREVPKAPASEPARTPKTETAFEEQPETTPPQTPLPRTASAPEQPGTSEAETAAPPHSPEHLEEDLWRELEALNDEEAPEEDPAGHSRTELPDWERATSGYPQAFARTFLRALSNPKAFFSAMPVGYGYAKPLLFFLIIIQAVALSQSIWQLLGILPPSLLTEDLGHTAQAALALILYPLEVSIFLFMDTAINHFFLRLFKADTKGFEGTFRAEAYSAAPMLLMVIPYIGMPLAMIGTTVYKFLGLRHVHGASNKQVLAVLILPMLLAMAVAIILTLATGRI
jgi:predicted Zn finger-like uncharacterized protein